MDLVALLRVSKVGDRGGDSFQSLSPTATIAPHRRQLAVLDGSSGCWLDGLA
jgi:hypothetical protein